MREGMALASWIYEKKRTNKTSLEDFGFERNDKEARSNPMETASMMRLIKTGAELPHIKSMDIGLSVNTQSKGSPSRQPRFRTMCGDAKFAQRPDTSPPPKHDVPFNPALNKTRKKKSASASSNYTRVDSPSNIWGESSNIVTKGTPKKRIFGIGNWRHAMLHANEFKGSEDIFQNPNIIKTSNTKTGHRPRRGRRRKPALLALRRHLHSAKKGVRTR